MRINMLITLCVSFIFLAAIICHADGTNGEAVTQSTGAPAPVKEAPSEKRAKPAPVRPQTMKKVDFAGVVTYIDPTIHTITLRRNGKTISFDMTGPILVGYGNINEIRRGDAVSVGYTSGGLMIRKGSFQTTHRGQVYTTSSPKAAKAKTKKNSPIRMTKKADPACFSDMDNNKDGKISPVELSVALPGLTIEKFKEYDANGDGCMDQSEFKTLKKRR